jgi:hypothetical protein
MPDLTTDIISIADLIFALAIAVTALAAVLLARWGETSDDDDPADQDAKLARWMREEWEKHHD